jgi:hypothetical protein
MYRDVVFFLIAAIGFSVSAQTINLTGTVTNKSGKPIAGAVTTLIGKNLKDTTDAAGAFAIKSDGVGINTDPILPSAEKISMANGIIALSLTKTMQVTIELFDMNGQLLNRVLSRSVSAGDYRFNIAQHTLATNMMAIRVSIGDRTSTFRYLPRINTSSVTTRFSENGAAQRISKLQATFDSIKVTANNYISQTVAISSYTGEVNISLDTITLPKFSFFVTSLKALTELSGSANGFGGDFRFGKTGPGAGLRGADSICSCIAEKSMPGSGVKIWRAFLSVTADENGKQVNAVDRIGNGPWYDRKARLLAPTLTDLMNVRPLNGDIVIKNDLPNEDGIPNHYPDGSTAIDNHHMVTGSDSKGKLYSATATCADWTSTTATGQPQCGFAWPRSSTGTYSWMTGFAAGGCAAGIHITTDNGGSQKIIGSNGGYGGFYCFALNP